MNYERFKIDLFNDNGWVEFAEPIEVQSTSIFVALLNTEIWRCSAPQYIPVRCTSNMFLGIGLQIFRRAAAGKAWTDQ